MTSGFASATVLGTMLLHAAFGCCWHHSHGVCAGSRGGESAVHAHSGHGQAGHRHAGELPAPDVHLGNGLLHTCEENGDDGDSEHEHGDCAGDVCRFVAASPVEVPAADGLPPLRLTANFGLPLAVALRAARLARSEGPPGGRLSTTRLRPWLGVWRV